MVAPTTITSIASPLDPLLFLPTASPLPTFPQSDLNILLCELDAALAGQSALPISVLTAQIRLATRNAQALMNSGRKGTAEARTELDGVDTELRGVEYELNRVREEIAKCEEYSPAYKELVLPSAESFLTGASEKVKASLPDPSDDAYEHALAIAQLEHELAEIEQHESTVAELTKERDTVIRSNKEIKTKFITLDAWMHDYAKTTNTISKKLDTVA